jgi:hypothetical protein
MTDKMSKRDIEREAARLRRAWNPGAKTGPSPHEQLRALDQEVRSAQTFDAAQECTACLQARADANDPSALCDVHLRAALGF